MQQPRPQVNAYHEAGHAVFGWRLGLRLLSVSIRPASTSGRTEFDVQPDPGRLAVVTLAGCLAQKRAYPANWPINCRRDFAIFEELTAPLVLDDPDARVKVHDEAKALIGDARIWRAIEALAIVLGERPNLDGIEATEIIRAAYEDGDDGDSRL